MEHPEFYEPETLKRLQGEILSILDDFMAVCDKYHLEYFGIAGTGIGAVRHKGFIPGTMTLISPCRGMISTNLSRLSRRPWGTNIWF